MPGAEMRGGWGMTVKGQFLWGVMKVSMGRYNPHGHSNNNWHRKVITTNAS